MLSPKTFCTTLRTVKGIKIQSPFYRFMSVEYINNLLSSIGSRSGGRYNLQNSFEVLYMAHDPQTSIEETTKAHNFRLPPKMLITIDVKTKKILDFKNKKVLELLEIDSEELFTAWRYPSKEESFTQKLGRLVYETKIFEGIRYPSAIIKNKFNLAIFPDRLLKGSSLKIYDPDKLIQQIIKGK